MQKLKGKNTLEFLNKVFKTCLCIQLFFLFPSVLYAAFPDPLINTATVAAPAGINDPTPGNNFDSDSNTLGLTSLAIVKTLTGNADEDGFSDVSLGDTLTYTVTATNDGSTTLNNVTVVDNLITATGGTTPCASVAPGGTCTLIGTYSVVQADVDAGNIANTGGVTSDEIATPVETTLNTPVAQTDLEHAGH